MYNFIKKINSMKKFAKQIFSRKLSTINYKPSTNSGFSLIELIVVVGIMIVITSVVLVNHTRFSGAFTLENLAYEIALTVRQAQFFGLNVRGADIGASTTFETGYGVHFDTSSPTSFIFFADTDKDHIYNGASDVVVDVYNITQGNQIASLCLDSACSTSVNQLTIAFSRPDPDAYITTGTPTDCGGAYCAEGIVVISSSKPTIADKKITVTSTGQISVGKY